MGIQQSTVLRITTYRSTDFANSMRSLLILLAFTSIYVWLGNHNAEGCCCELANAACSDCNFFGCNCEALIRGYCRRPQTSGWFGGGCSKDPDDYCPDKRKRSTSEFKKIYKKISPDYERIDAWDKFSSLDLNHDGTISFEETLAFKNITESGNRNQIETNVFAWAKKQWGLMDNNQDGTVTPHELQTYLR